mmetsp:Transcript_22660/g.89931  ORF Transcript_22660/g.89931 Transcript_22660/m.89931 type:complete len:146 (+) Transcript_22660:23-460(+)
MKRPPATRRGPRCPPFHLAAWLVLAILIFLLLPWLATTFRAAAPVVAPLARPSSRGLLVVPRASGGAATAWPSKAGQFVKSVRLDALVHQLRVFGKARLAVARPATTRARDASIQRSLSRFRRVKVHGEEGASSVMKARVPTVHG